jgi:acetyl-CoA C-acetyltransferase
MSSETNQAVIVAAKRTPIGGFMGGLAGFTAPELGSQAIQAALAASKLAAASINQVYMGNVLTAGVGQAPARQASIGAGIPNTVGATTINKVCGSGLMAVHLASQSIRLGDAEICVAGGMESMSNAPYLVPGARSGLKYGNANLIDAMIHDGLWDVYNNMHMGSCAELCAKERKISREAQDKFTIESYQRALQSAAQKYFEAEIVPIEIKSKKGSTIIKDDEEPTRFQPEKIPTLKPAFQENGTVTAANASSINDGAAALILTNETTAKKNGCEILGRIRGFSGAAMAPEWFTVAPSQAINNLLRKVDLKPSDIDLYEINEAFAVVSLAVATEVGIDLSKVNIRGGAVALGHPIGASGARILVTLLHALKQTGGKRGVAAICLGGGEAVAMLVERP